MAKEIDGVNGELTTMEEESKKLQLSNKILRAAAT